MSLLAVPRGVRVGRHPDAYDIEELAQIGEVEVAGVGAPTLDEVTAAHDDGVYRGDLLFHGPTAG
jgi:hypothetical protein